MTTIPSFSFSLEFKLLSRIFFAFLLLFITLFFSYTPAHAQIVIDDYSRSPSGTEISSPVSYDVTLSDLGGGTWFWVKTNTFPSSPGTAYYTECLEYTGSGPYFLNYDPVTLPNGNYGYVTLEAWNQPDCTELVDDEPLEAYTGSTIFEVVDAPPPPDPGEPSLISSVFVQLILGAGKLALVVIALFIPLAILIGAFSIKKFL